MFVINSMFSKGVPEEFGRSMFGNDARTFESPWIPLCKMPLFGSAEVRAHGRLRRRRPLPPLAEHTINHKHNDNDNDNSTIR